MTALAQYGHQSLAPADLSHRDGAVVVERVQGLRELRAARRPDGRVHVWHGFDAASLDDDLAVVLAAALTPFSADPSEFTEAFAGIVTTSDSDPDRAWVLFYLNTLARADDPSRRGYGQVHRRAISLLAGYRSVLDLGCSLGFLSLLLARRGTATIAADPNPGVLRLLASVGSRLDAPVRTIVLEQGPLPLPARSVDAVALLHVLEHVTAAEGTTLLEEALRVARRRVVVAVPYELHPTALYGHVRTLTRGDLDSLGSQTGWAYRVEERYGGWLILDRTRAARPGRHAAA